MYIILAMRIPTLTNADKLQLVVRGFSNRHRIRMLFLLENEPKLTVQELADKSAINFRTASEHTKKLRTAGLISKKYNNREVEHQLTPLGEQTLVSLQKLNKHL